MTAPGFGVQLLGDAPQFGCSLAAPCVAAGATILWSKYPNLIAAQVKEALVNSGRRPSATANVAPTPAAKAAFLRAAGIQLDEQLGIDKCYTQAVEQLYDDIQDRETFTKVMASEILRNHVFKPKDAIKYKNHLDIDRALAYAKAHLTNKANIKGPSCEGFATFKLAVQHDLNY